MQDPGPGSTRIRSASSSRRMKAAYPVRNESEFVGTTRMQSLREPDGELYDRPTSPGPMRALTRLTILVVEDDPDARELMQAILEQHGASVEAAESVARALEILETFRPDLIISDIAMPEEDGITFVQKLRQRAPEAGGSTPAIAVSAFSATSDRLRALAAGFTHYLHKPVDFEKLSQAIISCTTAKI